MKDAILGFLAVIACAPILIWIIKYFVIGIIKETYSRSRTETPSEKAKAIAKAVTNVAIAMAVIVLVGLCSYNPDPEHHERYDEYQQRLEPKW